MQTVIKFTCDECGVVYYSALHKDAAHGVDEMRRRGFDFNEAHIEINEFSGDGHNEPVEFMLHGTCPECNGVVGEPVQLPLF